MDFVKEVLKSFGQFICRFFATSVDSLYQKSPQQDFSGLPAQERGSSPLLLLKQLAAKDPIMLNGRKPAFMEQNYGSVGAVPLLGNGKE